MDGSGTPGVTQTPPLLVHGPPEPGLRRAIDALHADPSAVWSLARLASRAGMSRSVFAERFRSRVGTSPMRYLAGYRMRRACALLSDETLSVGEVGRRVGYASEAAFNRAFRQRLGEPPGRYRRRLLRRQRAARFGRTAKDSGRRGNPRPDVAASILRTQTGTRPGGGTP